MPRQARSLSETGVYHVIFRGVNRCLIFEQPADYDKFLGLLGKVKDELSLELYAYCLMGNHAHLVVKEPSPGVLTRAMRKILGPYAYWFNRRYGRSGALIANRFRSQAVTTDAYLLTVVRYVHHNPVAAGLASRPGDYPWSSYRGYLGAPTLADPDFVLTMLDSDLATSRARFEAFHAAGPHEEPPALDTVRRPDGQIRGDLAAEFDGLEPAQLSGLDKPRRDEALGFLRRRGYSIRQIERVTGVPRGVVARAGRAER